LVTIDEVMLQQSYDKTSLSGFSKKISKHKRIKA